MASIMAIILDVLKRRTIKPFGNHQDGVQEHNFKEIFNVAYTTSTITKCV